MPKRLFMSIVILALILGSLFTFITSDNATASSVVTYVVNASRDDAWSKSNDVKWDTDECYLSIADTITGCRWQIDIPKGATILNANFICKAKNQKNTLDAIVRIEAFDQDSCDDFDTIFWNWPVMSEYVDWLLPGLFLPNMWYMSPDLKTIIQAYINRTGYTAGNYFGLRIKYQSGEAAGHEFWSWDFNPDNAVKLEIAYVPPKPPLADFQYTPGNPIINEIITFNATASYSLDGYIVKYSWNFGDSTPEVEETDPIVLHSFTTSGFYNVTLNVTDSNGLTNSTTKEIKIRNLGVPVASFTYLPQQPIVNETVTFNASSSYDPDGTIIGFEWNFGDDVNATGMVTYHSYNSTGTYMVTLKVTDDDLITDYKTEFISVSKYPIASFEYSPLNPVVGEVITFNASTSTPNGGFLATYQWDFGDNTSILEIDPITTHTYLTHGNYSVTLNVTDSEGLCSITSKSVIIRAPPIALFTYSPSTPIANRSTTFNASLSYDPDGNVINYTWDFGDGNITYTMESVINHTYSLPGNYSVTLTIADNHGLTSMHQVSLRVSNYPKADFTFSPASPLEREIITFNASSSTPNGAVIISYVWNFGDGNTSIATTPIIKHVYQLFGNYEVTLNVTDSEGLWDTEYKLVIVHARPVASFVFSPAYPVPNQRIFLNATSSHDPDGFIVNYTWNFGDGNVTVTYDNVVWHVYTENGSYSIILTVVDNEGYSNSTLHTLSVNVHDIATLNVTVSDTEVYVGQIVNITITVKNEGTATESFNINIFCNETLLETIFVANLTPNAERILVFEWNTSTITPVANFLVRAAAEVITGENDTADNAYAGGIVTILQIPTNGGFSPLDWNLILLLLIPLAILLFAGGITWKKRHMNQKFKGFEVFDQITDGGIPSSFSVLITGEPGSGKSVLCQQLTYKFLTEGKPCVYVTYDCFPNEVRENMKKFNWDLSNYEKEERIVFVDCFSSTAQVTSGEKYSINQPFSLSDLGITISKATSEAANAPKVFFDSVVPLLTHVDHSRVVEFLQDRSARIKGANGTFIFTVGKETIEPNLLSRLEELADCVIELNVGTSQGKTIRSLRVKKMRGRKASDKWIQFDINPAAGIIFYLNSRLQS